MSNGRRGNVGNRYRSSYLQSVPWFRRRDAWFAEEARRAGMVLCAITGQAGTKRTLQLHHVDYAGVSRVDGRWRAQERHEDLVAVRPDAHEALHRLLDRDQALRRGPRRRVANYRAIARLQRRWRTPPAAERNAG